MHCCLQAALARQSPSQQDPKAQALAPTETSSQSTDDGLDPKVGAGTGAAVK